MSKKSSKDVAVPSLLTREWLSGFVVDGNADIIIGTTLASEGFVSALKNTHKESPDGGPSSVLSSREMEIALADHVFLYKNFNPEVDEFFLKHYPATLENAMRLAFKYYLGDDFYGDSPKKHPHYETLLDSVKKERKESKFYENCCLLKNGYNELTEKVKDTWLEIKDVSFEEALVAVNVLYIEMFSQYFDRLNEQYDDTIMDKSGFLQGATVYLTKCRENVNKNLWNETSTLLKEMNGYSVNFQEDKTLLKKIYAHISAVELLQEFRFGVCESFMYDEKCELDMKEKKYVFDEADDKLCGLKNRLLVSYYEAMAMRVARDRSLEYIPHCYIPLLGEYFGLKKQLLDRNDGYSIQQLIIDKAKMSGMYTFDAMFSSFAEERRLLDVVRIPDSNAQKKYKLLSIDVSDDKSPIDIYAYNMLYCGQSDAFVVLPFISATNDISYHSLVRRLRKSKNAGGNENREWGKEWEECIAFVFTNFPAFHPFPECAAPKITKGCKFFRSENGVKKDIAGEIDVAIYNKDKTLILIEAKSTYGIIMFDERHKHEKHLIHAGHQLNKALKALRENPGLLFKVTGDKSVKFDDLKIETMIVSTSFEFDGQEFEGHQKISLLELMIFLRNHANYLVELSPGFKKQLADNPNRRISLKHLDIYGDGDLTVGGFLKKLHNFNLWEKVMPYWQEKLL
jgi:hypothetical protein